MRMLKRIWSHLLVLTANRCPSHYKQLASSKAAAMVNCEFCLMPDRTG